MQVLFLVRNSCRDEYRAHCSDVDIGGGRVVECLEANAASLSPGCQSALADLGR
jgi:Cysteine rich repeat